MRKILSLALVASFSLGSALASDDANKPKALKNCAGIIDGIDLNHIAVVESGRDGDVLPELMKRIAEIYGRGQLLDQLHFPNSPHTLMFIPSSNLSVLATMARHPVRHWADGAEIVQGAFGAAGVLEFVTPAGELCQHRSCYSDTTDFEHQVDILHHVAGHNLVADTSYFSLMRRAEPIEESAKLATLMDELYQKYGKEEVAHWYQMLLSTTYLQDLVEGSFDLPSKFTFNREGSRENGLVHPKAPTPSVLQAMVSNLPSDAPAWKHQMTAMFEKTRRVLGYYVQTKVLNEGWATFSHTFLRAHSKHKDSHHAMEAADLLKGVAWPSLSNPYWLGLEGWNRIYDRFKKRPDIAPLDPKTQDVRFVDFARQNVISTMNDYDFIKYALDEEWVNQYNLYLSRPAQPHELDPDVQRKLKPGEVQHIVITRDYKRVIAAIARRFDRSTSIPRLLAVNFRAPDNTVLLRHDVRHGIPLERTSAVKTLFVLSRILEKNVEVESVGSTLWSKPKPQQDLWQDFPGWWRPTPPPTHKPFPIKFRVSPKGEVQVLKDGKPDLELQEPLQKALDAFKVDFDDAGGEDLAEFNEKKFMGDLGEAAPMIKEGILEAVDSTLNSVKGMGNHAPTASGAVRDWAQMVNKRATAAIWNAIRGKTKIKRVGGNIRLRVLPEIPQFGLDRQVAESIDENQPQTPMDLLMQAAQMKVGPQAKDRDLDIGQGPHRPGKRIPGPGKNKGQGQGEDGEDGDPQDPNDPNRNHGDGGTKDPSEIDFPEHLFAKVIAAYFKLPNMRDTTGGNATMETMRISGTRKPKGDLLYERMTPDIMAMGKLSLQRKGVKNIERLPQSKIYEEGLKYMTPADYITPNRMEIPRPKSKAVLVFVMDATGSMGGLPQQLENQLFWTMRMLVRANYDEVVIRYVLYDDKAIEVPEEKAFRTTMGGGNTDSVGYIKAEEILNDYDAGDYNFYVFGAGDGGSSDTAATIAAMKRLYDRCQYVGWTRIDAYGQSWGGFDAFIGPIKKLAEDLPNFGFSDLKKSEEVFESLGKLIKQEQPK